MGRRRYDAIIAGCGCAGLSLALRLLEQAPQMRLCLLDKEHGAHPHKLWSFWDADPASVLPLEDVGLQTWDHMEVGGANFRRRESLGALKYATVQSEVFEARALERIRAHPNVDIISRGVRNLVDAGTHVSVHADGEIFVADFVFQSYRLCPRDLGRQVRFPVAQTFGGWLVHTEQPQFDPSTFSLMDFDLPQRDGPTFLYVLPFDEHRALFEYTLFSPTHLAPEDCRQALCTVLRSRVRGAYQVERAEYGNIPMTDRQIRPRWSPRIFNLGVVGGMSKPTTGYAFHRIQRQTAHLASTWLKSGTPAPLPSPPGRFQLYDMILLDVLMREGHRGHRIFERLFARSRYERVLQFLDERTSFTQEMAMLAALPWGTFFRGLPRGVRAMLGGGAGLPLPETAEPAQ